ncbi:uncharacterized protein LOC126590087 isoform X3 [Malus sylvestris]|uniref:uncharacterized protein LOC126590087 isoform X1 n=1 Tax=Malus sylvestris TaxID=3752 RepID=UPI0021AC646A|nr:uncharacterized protein LOC126590087 isoform X1 [Malus sylvestris]XP_050111541.1 uncharacterized protein LOC126590087 isoform X2 [Malus sylvestris]XP_050111542.1 uncharacterized protein LOC126590087 isoform X3 [Malus sylvestris]
MGSVCCVAAKKRTHPNRTEGETLCRNAIRSPSWNFQWDNRQRVSSEIGTPYQVSRGISTNDSMELKGALSSERGNFSDLGSPLENFGTPISQKSPVHGGTGTNLSPSPGEEFDRITGNCKFFCIKCFVVHAYKFFNTNCRTITLLEIQIKTGCKWQLLAVSFFTGCTHTCCNYKD